MSGLQHRDERSNRDRVTVLVAENDPLLRCLLADHLASEPDLSVIAATPAGPDLPGTVQTHQPGVVLLDLPHPSLPGLQTVEEINVCVASPNVLLLGDESEESPMEAARHGARGFLPRSAGTDLLTRAVRAVSHGDLWFPPRILDRILLEYSALIRRAREQERPINQLSDRERQVLLCVARGMTNREIARDLYLSIHTIKLQIQNILRKLSLPNRTEAAVFALREGLLDSPTPTPEKGL
jgi:two-component system NarL family response regulator